MPASRKTKPLRCKPRGFLRVAARHALGGRNEMHDLHDFSAVHGLQEAVFRGYHANHANHAERSNHAGYRNHANHAKRSDHAGYRNHANHAGHAKAQKTALKRPRWPIRPAGGRMETQESLSVSCACVPLSVSPPCGRLASPPAGGAKRTAVKPGEQRVRRSCEQVCLTTA